MARNENQQKIVLDPDQQELLKDALLLATEYSRAMATISRAMNDHSHAAEYAERAQLFQELLTYAPEVVRVAVTVEVPGLRAV